MYNDDPLRQRGPQMHYSTPYDYYTPRGLRTTPRAILAAVHPLQGIGSQEVRHGRPCKNSRDVKAGLECSMTRVCKLLTLQDRHGNELIKLETDFVTWHERDEPLELSLVGGMAWL